MDDRITQAANAQFPTHDQNTEGVTNVTEGDLCCYGALRGGNPDNTEAAIVTDALQQKLDKTPSGVVMINNANLGRDPAVGAVKHFGAIVEVGGVQRPFACQEGQTIDFS